MSMVPFHIIKDKRVFFLITCYAEITVLLKKRKSQTHTLNLTVGYKITYPQEQEPVIGSISLFSPINSKLNVKEKVQNQLLQPHEQWQCMKMKTPHN